MRFVAGDSGRTDASYMWLRQRDDTWHVVNDPWNCLRFINLMLRPRWWLVFSSVRMVR